MVVAECGRLRRRKKSVVLWSAPSKFGCLATIKAPNYPKNECFIFIKPHAVTEKVKELIVKTFEEKGIRIQKEGKLDGRTIDNEKRIQPPPYSKESRWNVG